MLETLLSRVFFPGFKEEVWAEHPETVLTDPSMMEVNSLEEQNWMVLVPLWPRKMLAGCRPLSVQRNSDSVAEEQSSVYI